MVIKMQLHKKNTQICRFEHMKMPPPLNYPKESVFIFKFYDI